MSDFFESPVFLASMMVLLSFIVAWVFQNDETETKADEK